MSGARSGATKLIRRAHCRMERSQCACWSYSPIRSRRVSAPACTRKVDDCDLNAEGFDPVMTRQDRLDYYDVPGNRGRVASYVDRLLKSDALIFSFPVWNMGFPAILKGFVDKVFLPGVSFNLKDDGSYVPCLHNIKRLGAVCTYGGARWTTFLMGDPPRRFLKRSMRLNCAPGARCDYFAGYDMDHTTPERRVRFLKAVERKFATW
jgi:NAD(P)H dehydrogenase (quinone)